MRQSLQRQAHRSARSSKERNETQLGQPLAGSELALQNALSKQKNEAVGLPVKAAFFVRNSWHCMQTVGPAGSKVNYYCQ